MDKINIRPSELRNFGETTGASFCLVTSPDIADAFELQLGSKYTGGIILPYDGDLNFGEFIQTQSPEGAHILAILPGTYVKSPTPAQVGPRRKLAVMACSSTPTTLESIAHFISVAERTDPDEQNATAQAFFENGERSKHLRFVDTRYGTSATFRHLSDALGWHEQMGRLEWGEQQLIPSGEISVLPVSVFDQDIDSTFDVEGELAFRGFPVLHSGTPSHLPADQERIFRALATLEDHALIARVSGGAISDIRPTSSAAQPAADILGALFAVDSRYRKLLEIGFGINFKLNLFPGNAAMNEVYGGSRGVVHYGIGLIPFTQYHLDLLCPGTQVLDDREVTIFGAPEQSARQ